MTCGGGLAHTNHALLWRTHAAPRDRDNQSGSRRGRSKLDPNTRCVAARPLAPATQLSKTNGAREGIAPSSSRRRAAQAQIALPVGEDMVSAIGMRANHRDLQHATTGKHVLGSVAGCLPEEARVGRTAVGRTHERGRRNQVYALGCAAPHHGGHLGHAAHEALEQAPGSRAQAKAGKGQGRASAPPTNVMHSDRSATVRCGVEEAAQVIILRDSLRRFRART
ncbi:hypothetical protein GQ53DRAFT_773930 [Thozetella sp. PMI_491]|nr:hypothetical protein GQ53DRAFT_773930 [Thozetella sp. PMI_491]